MTAEKVKIRKYAVGFDTVQSGTLPEVKTRVIYRVSCVKVNSVVTVLLLLGTYESESSIKTKTTKPTALPLNNRLLEFVLNYVLSMPVKGPGVA